MADCQISSLQSGSGTSHSEPQFYFLTKHVEIQCKFAWDYQKLGLHDHSPLLTTTGR
jgi:hypothetical protein